MALNADGTFTYQPDSVYMGSDSFHYLARDRQGRPSPPATVAIYVGLASAAPAARADPVFRPGFSEPSGGERSEKVVTGDVSGDGTPDLIVLNQNSVSIRYSDWGGRKSFSDGLVQPTDVAAWPVLQVALFAPVVANPADAQISRDPEEGASEFGRNVDPTNRDSELKKGAKEIDQPRLGSMRRANEEAERLVHQRLEAQSRLEVSYREAKGPHGNSQYVPAIRPRSHFDAYVMAI